jgi:polyisoprenyl-teichoic acid--peptidoglycan teichoic acid transferase
VTWRRAGMIAAAVGVAVAAAVIAVPAGGGRPASAATPNPSASSGPAVVVGSAHGASYVPALRGNRPLFILVLGSDARTGLGGTRADSIHLVGVNLKKKRASVLGFPRDSWVNIPGVGTNKINTALTYGGPELVVKTVESLTGITIDFWVLTGFQGFRSMVNGIGGLDVRVLQPMHDSYSGANFDPGLRHFDGQKALAFARDRHTLARGDIDRSANQGRLMLAALGKLQKVFDDDPSKLFDWISVGWRNTASDLDVATIVDLGLTAAQIPPSNVTNTVVPASSGTVGSQSVVFISSSASSLYQDMKADGVIDHP